MPTIRQTQPNPLIVSMTSFVKKNTTRNISK